MKKRNKIALDLFTKKYRKRIVKPKKGKGSFKKEQNINKTKTIIMTNSNIKQNRKTTNKSNNWNTTKNKCTNESNAIIITRGNINERKTTKQWND